jgi:hypothetical protein
MLLSPSSRKESLLQKACGTALVQIHAGCLRAGSFLSPQLHVRASLSACLWQIILNDLPKAGEILLPVGYLPHFF